jgi:hypothetical protein
MSCFKQRASRAMIGVLAFTGLATTLGLSPAQAAVFDLQSSAYDVGINLNLLGVASLSVGPFVSASGLAPPSYDVSNSLLTASGGGSLGGLASLTVTTGAVNASASSPYPTPTTTGSSSIDDLSIALKTTGLVPLTLLDITAHTITSTSTASDVNSPPTAVGSSEIEDLTIGGLLLGANTIDLTGSITPLPNDVILDLAGIIKVTLNQQIMESNGGAGVSIETNALAIDIPGISLAGLKPLSGDIIIGNSFAMVPEPSTWVEMLAGFGGLGFLAFARGRRKTAAAV